MISFEINKIYQGDSTEVLKTFPNTAVDMCITSPPYFGLRDYGVDGQLGLEANHQTYLGRLWEIFREVRRVLKPEGSLWVNLGDGYAGSGKGRGDKLGNLGTPRDDYPPRTKSNVSAKSLCMIPERFAIGMVDRGWLLRNVIIWHKPSCLPESVKDRFTKDFEYLYFFTKQKKYYFEQQFEPIKDESKKRAGYGRAKHKNATSQYLTGITNFQTIHKPSPITRVNPDGRNKRAVWSINPQSFKGAHFATFPEKLITTPILAGCPEGGIVLDTFMGSGRTGIVAIKNNRNYVGIELNPDYIEIAEAELRKCSYEHKNKLL